MDARPTTGLAAKAAILMIVLAGAVAGPAAASAGHKLSLARAEVAARKAVREHSSYRGIDSARTDLETRRCWRGRARSVRCSLYVVVPSPCALDQEPDRVCAQSLWERRWLVAVKRSSHRIAADILEISSGPAAG